MFGLNKELVILGLAGFGLFAQRNEINLCNNTTILVILFLLFLEHEENEHTRRELCCVEKCTGTTMCRCVSRNRFF